MNLLKNWFKIKKNKTAYKHEHDFYFFYFLGLYALLTQICLFFGRVL